jgi:hypothetical protein
MSMTEKNLIFSRRDFLAGIGYASASFFFASPSAYPQTPASRPTGAQFKLVKELEDASWHSFSPDSQRMCVTYSKQPIGKFVMNRDRIIAQQRPDNNFLSVIDLGSWKEVPIGSVSGGPVDFEFSEDSNFLFGEQRIDPLKVPPTAEWIRVDIRSFTVQTYRYSVTQPSFHLQAFTGSKLIGTHGNRWVQVEWPSFKETSNVEMETPNEGFTLSPDRKLLLHTVKKEEKVVCRSTEDFKRIWTRTVDPEIDFNQTRLSQELGGGALRSVAAVISPDDETVAIGARRLAPNLALDAYGRVNPLVAYVDILNGKDGSQIAKWALDQEGIALSPKGRLIAIAKVEPVKGVGWQPTAHIHDIASGKEVATVVHDSVAGDKFLGTSLSRGMSFTADGKYLVTSANNKVKIWEVAYS